MTLRWIVPVSVAVMAWMAFLPCVHAESPPVVPPFADARAAVARGELDQALDLLQQGLEAGLTPPALQAEEAWAPLVADPASRPRVRELLRAHAHASSLRMTLPSEPGATFAVEGLLVDGATGEPLPGALIELAQAAADGLYFEGEGEWNPRLFAYLRSGDDGAFRVDTIRPGSYSDDRGSRIPAHVHFSIELAGYRPYHSEFLLGDDPLAGDPAASGPLVAEVHASGDGATATITIPMQRVESE